jgi:hypothetical protein
MGRTRRHAPQYGLWKKTAHDTFASFGPSLSHAAFSGYNT